MNNTLQEAAALVKDHEFSIAAIQDLERIQELIPKSALSYIDPDSEQRIEYLKHRVQEYVNTGQRLSGSQYLFVMMMANNLIRDDHTNVFVNEIKSDQLLYSGFVVTAVQNVATVVHSNNKQIPTNSVVVGVNERPIQEHIDKFTRLFSPSTDNEHINTRRALAYLSIYNPFMTVRTLQFVAHGQKQVKSVSIKYMNPKRALFSRDLRRTLQQILFKLIYTTNNHDQVLSVGALKSAGVLYFDLHTFNAQNKKLAEVAYMTRHIQEPWARFIVLDMRSNLGGSLLVLNQIIKHMYGDKIMNQLQTCTVNRFATNQEMLQQYHDEVILPVLSDASVPKNTKQIYKSVYKLMCGHIEKGEFCDRAAKASKCSKNMLAQVQREVASGLRNGTFNKYIVIISDSLCFSSCLWTSKFLLSLPNAVLIGKSLSNTRFSGNAVHFNLRSGKSSIAVPQVYSQLLNAPMKQAVQRDVTPDFEVDTDVLNSREGKISLIISIVAKQQMIIEAAKKKAASLDTCKNKA